jgi:hypothetical protein
MEREHYQEGNGRSVELANAARRFADELLRANLIVPQSYSAVRVMGALSLLKETATAYDFTPTELFEALYDLEDEVTQKFVEQMHTAHAPYGVEPKDFEGKPEEDIHERVIRLIRYHRRAAYDACHTALEFANEQLPGKSDEEVQQYAIDCVSVVYDALMDNRLRQAIREYRLNTAMDRFSKETFAEHLREAWGPIFMEKLAVSSVAPKDKASLERIALFFAEITDSTEDVTVR